MRAILTYHAIDRSGSVISVSPEAFASHVAWLASGRVRVVSIAELLALPEDCDAVALTFDDALASVASEAAPLLADAGLHGTVFVVTDHVGGDNRWRGVTDPGIPVAAVLDWDALGRLVESGWSAGSHTRTHPHLPECSDAALADELDGSAEAIAAGLGVTPDIFAYPYGDSDPRSTAAVATRYAAACTTDYLPFDATPDPAMIPRLDAWYFRDGSAFRDWGSRRFRRGIAWRHALRRVRRMIG
ncbi:MAG: polysaccharide deacetylase family protein [Gemmatimonadota bacterium]